MTESEIFAECLRLGMTAAGAAGATANILRESAGRPDNLEDSYNRKLGVSDADYVRQVDAGTRDFLAPGQGGFGLCQWTSINRRRELLNYAQGYGKSIADPRMQFNFMAREMRQSYAYVWSILTHTADPYEAGYVMCAKYEIPANTEQTARVRGDLARQVYARCAGAAPAEEPTAGTEGPAEEPGVEKIWPPRMLCKGMEGADVTVLQALLVAHGYSVSVVNGIFEDSTEKALRDFQADRGLAVDGVAGDQSWTALRQFMHVRR